MRASRPPSGELSATQRGRPAHPQAWPQPARARPRTHTNRVTSSRPFALRLCGANVYPSAWCARHKGSSSLARPRPPRTHATVPSRSRDSVDTRGGREPGARWAAALPSPAPRAKGSRRARVRCSCRFLAGCQHAFKCLGKSGTANSVAEPRAITEALDQDPLILDRVESDRVSATGIVRVLVKYEPHHRARCGTLRSERFAFDRRLEQEPEHILRRNAMPVREPGVPQFCPCTLENTFCRDWWPLSHAETGVYHGDRRRIGEISRVLVCSPPIRGSQFPSSGPGAPI